MKNYDYVIEYDKLERLINRIRKFWYGTIEQTLVRGVVHFMADGVECKYHIDQWLRPCQLPMLTAVLNWTDDKLYDEWGKLYYAQACKGIRWETLETRKVKMLSTDINKMKWSWNEEEIAKTASRAI